MLVLSLFPGIGLLDRAFEEEGFCVVRGPDLLWGGDVRNFHPPTGKFDGVIGGPPCQFASSMSQINSSRGRPSPDNLIPEFERCVAEAMPDWYVMENVRQAPHPEIENYHLHTYDLRDVWCGGETQRFRRFSFGSRRDNGFLDRRGSWQIETLALHLPDPEPAALASGTSWDSKNGRPAGARTRATFENHKRLQGLPPGFDLPPFTIAAKVKAIGNGVPIAMGRAVARAVRTAVITAGER